MTIKKIVFPIRFIAFSHKDFSVEGGLNRMYKIILFGILFVNVDTNQETVVNGISY